MKISFKKRIALFNTIAVAITMAIVFAVIYLVANFSSFRHMNAIKYSENNGEITCDLGRKQKNIIHF
jgi:multidrug efflux pump subunit AcrB